VPPGDVTNLVVQARSGAVTFTWQRPVDVDFAYVSITRAHGAEAPTAVYSGPGGTFTDRNVRPGRRYAYVFAAYDAAGNRSAGVARNIIVPVASSLVAPANAARLSKPPMLRWRPVARASYYNVQLWRAGRKILSAWPTRPQLRLRATWRYGGASYRLSAGRYRWYVWPGYGSKARARYGRLLGQATFVIVRPG
jgi:hypothetical protein